MNYQFHCIVPSLDIRYNYHCRSQLYKCKLSLVYKNQMHSLVFGNTFLWLLISLMLPLFTKYACKQNKFHNALFYCLCIINYKVKYKDNFTMRIIFNIDLSSEYQISGALLNIMDASPNWIHYIYYSLLSGFLKHPENLVENDGICMNEGPLYNAWLDPIA